MIYHVAEHGFAIVPGVFSPQEASRIAEQIGPIPGAGLRGALGLDAVREVAGSPRLRDLLRSYLPLEPIPVRAICFDKSPDANWLVPWHQDLTIALRSRVEHPGFGSWSVKDGISHVQPPVELLEQMITVRLHLDDTHAGNGALRVIPGSHAAGRLSPEQIAEWASRGPEVVCEVPAGGVLLMRPLLMHASSRSQCTGHRRVLHIEYAGFSLPEGLEWTDLVRSTTQPPAASRPRARWGARASRRGRAS